MQMSYCYSLKWRYEFNNSKSALVIFGEARVVHCESMKSREWILGGETVDELYEYKNLRKTISVPSLRTLTTTLKRLVVRQG